LKRRVVSPSDSDNASKAAPRKRLSILINTKR
jgi:hypothetical protein